MNTRKPESAAFVIAAVMCGSQMPYPMIINRVLGRDI
jgi:hypothetical protein